MSTSPNPSEHQELCLPKFGETRVFMQGEFFSRLLAPALDVGASGWKVEASLSPVQLGPCVSRKQNTPADPLAEPQGHSRGMGKPLTSSNWKTNYCGWSFCKLCGELDHIAARGLPDCGSTHSECSSCDQITNVLFRVCSPLIFKCICISREIKSMGFQFIYP